MRPSPILDTATHVIVHTVGAFSLYLLFAGHNAPGGGFVGGLVAGAALVLLYAGRGTGGVRAVLPARPETLLGAGLLLVGLTGLGGFALGGAFLESGYAERELPVLGTVSVTSGLAFDAGVYLVVVGLVLAALRTLGGEPQRSVTGEHEPPAPQEDREVTP